MPARPRPMPYAPVQTTNDAGQMSVDEVRDTDTLHPAAGYTMTLTVCRDNAPIGWVWVSDFGYASVRAWIAADGA